MTSVEPFVRTLGLAAVACTLLAAIARGEPASSTTADMSTPVESKRPPKAIQAARSSIEAAESPADLPQELYFAIIREYEVRLAAHRRELLAREAELDATKHALTELRQKTAARIEPMPSAADRERWTDLQRSERDARAEASGLRVKVAALEKELRVLTTTSAEKAASPSPADRDKALIASLERELDVERANRATLETEIQRLVSESRSGDRMAALTQSLDSARAEILLLNQRLATEQRARESLEVSIERVRRAAALDPGEDWMDRFETNIKERRDQAERLQEELHRANEVIISLKGKLEAADGAKSPAPDVRGLESEVERLRDALHSAQQANADLRTQAELASRLAEILYGEAR
jgi:hypothetical protein